MGLASGMQKRFLNDPDFILHKKDNSPVTKADHAVQAAIESFLKTNAPDVVFVGEETLEDVVAQHARMPQTFWLCDPIDGTRQYAKGGDDYCINLALIDKGRPVFGMIAAPASGDIAITQGPDKTVFIQGPHEASVIRDMHKEGTRLVIGSNRSNDAVAFAERMNAKPEQVMVRPSALKFFNLLRNEADYYIREGQVSEWDIAAGEALLAAAGGYVRQFDGVTPLSYGNVDRRFLVNGLFASR